MKFYTNPLSNNSFRVELYLKEKGLEYEMVNVALMSGEHKKEEYLKDFPRGQVPGLKLDSGETLYESCAIIDFLENTTTKGPALKPPSSDISNSALFYTRLHEFHQKLDPANIFGSVAFGKKTKEELKDRIEKLENEVDNWDKYLEGRKFFAGEFSIVDIVIFPLIATWVFGLTLDLSTRPNLQEWFDSVSSRETVKGCVWYQQWSTQEGLKGTPFERKSILGKE
uniref:Glutathione S-transferase n=1 Tax=Prorocentrum micans TaxID=2945 RepID=A0A7S2TB82_PROMC|mmetsp:Transcript_12666/g.15732  ORF Transcript_12666/g.15732 Transcript_12666/m.15732 type:complete len:225 (+) Transcript_12666:251-925(+)